jgi:hypothetical protein
LLNEKAHVNLVSAKDGDTEVANTTKQMKKQMVEKAVAERQINAAGNKKKSNVNLNCLKLVLELIQASLIKNDNKMDQNETPNDTNDQEQTKKLYESFIQLIPYFFLILETIETNFDSTPTTTDDTAKKTLEKTYEKVDEEDSPQKVYLYLEIICLNCLLSIYKVNKLLNKSKLDKSKFNIELLMQILQTNDKIAEKNTQFVDRINVQEHILLLLSEIASIFPDKVLEHVLIMFVFVGNKLARKDDSFSFQIINKIIKTILPSIVNSVNSTQMINNGKPEYQVTKLENNSAETECKEGRLVKTINVIQRHQKELPYVSSLVCKILQSFVVALPHIPAHRKTIIFNQLLQIIGLKDYLWITIVQSIDHYLVQSNDLLDFTNNLQEVTTKQQQLLSSQTSSIVSKDEKKLRDTLKTNCQSMISLYIQFEPTQVIQSSIFLIAFLSKYFSILFNKASKLLISKSGSNDSKSTRI